LPDKAVLRRQCPVRQAPLDLQRPPFPVFAQVLDGKRPALPVPSEICFFSCTFQGDFYRLRQPRPVDEYNKFESAGPAKGPCSGSCPRRERLVGCPLTGRESRQLVGNPGPIWRKGPACLQAGPEFRPQRSKIALNCFDALEVQNLPGLGEIRKSRKLPALAARLGTRGKNHPHKQEPQQPPSHYPILATRPRANAAASKAWRASTDSP